MHPYVKPLYDRLLRHADMKTAVSMKAYMRDQFDFFGIKSGPRRDLITAHLQAYGSPAPESVPEIARSLWQLPERECQYCAMDLLQKVQRQLPLTALTTLEELITSKSWWDTVDNLASQPVGTLLQRYPDARVVTITRWRQSDNLWLRRTTLLFQLRYKSKTDAGLLFELIRDNLGSQEFFINKAIGWALREYSKVNATAVTEFVDTTPLHPLSSEEALKWLARKQ